MSCESFSYTKTVTVELKDADGVPIREGSVLFLAENPKEQGSGY